MSNDAVICRTPRLVLRLWTEADLGPLTRLNSDAQVMEHFLKPLTASESAAFYEQIQREFRERGYGLYVIEEATGGAFVGFVGLHNITFEVDFAPAVEIAWRLLPEFWNRGYASEAATACLDYARRELGLGEIVAFTALPNKRSERVMQKIGMKRVGEFDHPAVAPNHPLRRHTLYRITL